MNQDLPSPKFDEKEVDYLIADFGVKPSPEKHQVLQKTLEKQKEKFLNQERQHPSRERS